MSEKRPARAMPASACSTVAAAAPSVKRQNKERFSGTSKRAKAPAQRACVSIRSPVCGVSGYDFRQDGGVNLHLWWQRKGTCVSSEPCLPSSPPAARTLKSVEKLLAGTRRR